MLWSFDILSFPVTYFCSVVDVFHDYKRLEAFFIGMKCFKLPRNSNLHVLVSVFWYSSSNIFLCRIRITYPHLQWNCCSTFDPTCNHHLLWDVVQFEISNLSCSLLNCGQSSSIWAGSFVITLCISHTEGGQKVGGHPLNCLELTLSPLICTWLLYALEY